MSWMSLPSSLSGQLQRRLARLLGTQQPWARNSAEDDTYYGDISHTEGLLSTNNSTSSAASIMRALGIRQVIGFLLRILFSLLSVFSLLRYLLPRRGLPIRQKKGTEIHPLAFLDGLRAYASLIIFTNHTMSRKWKWIPQIILDIAWLQPPFRAGHACLNTFFWISGYVVTYKVIGFMQTKKYDKVLDTLCSSVFKRYLRLFLPVVMMNLITLALVPVGIVIVPPHIIGAAKESNMNVYQYWLSDLFYALDPFAHTGVWWTKDAAGSHTLDQFWSINTEFRQSMMLACFCMATCKMTSHKRIRLIWICFFACLAYKTQTACMAFFGMWCAEVKQQSFRDAEAKKLEETMLQTQTQTQIPTADGTLPSTHGSDELNEEKALSSDGKEAATSQSLSVPHTFISQSSRERSELWQKLRKPFLIGMFLFSFIIIRDPHYNYNWKTFPHNIINFVTPSFWPVNMKMYFHLIIGVSMMLYAIHEVPSLRWPLVQPFSQFLGELSFGIYATHRTVTFIWWAPRYLKWVKDYYTPRGINVTEHFFILLPGYLIMTLMVIWCAEFFRRMDMQIVKVLLKLEAFAFKQ